MFLFGRRCFVFFFSTARHCGKKYFHWIMVRQCDRYILAASYCRHQSTGNCGCLSWRIHVCFDYWANHQWNFGPKKLWRPFSIYLSNLMNLLESIPPIKFSLSILSLPVHKIGLTDERSPLTFWLALVSVPKKCLLDFRVAQWIE